MHGPHITPRLPLRRTQCRIHTSAPSRPAATLTLAFIHRLLRPSGASLCRHAYATRELLLCCFCCTQLPKQEGEQMQESCCWGGMCCVPSQWVRGAAKAKCLSTVTRWRLWFVIAAVRAAKTNKRVSCVQRQAWRVHRDGRSSSGTLCALNRGFTDAMNET